MEYFTRLHLYFLMIYISKLVSTTAEITIKTSVPVNPVKSGGILSLHCRIANLYKSHQVTIFRKLAGRHSEMLSVNEDVLPAIEDRVFLAVRQLLDGSSVYFLSITGVQRDDQGVYSCKVTGPSGNDERVTVGRGSANITVQYFPSETYPVCTPNEALTLTEGKLTTLNCSSETSNPLVKITWVKTGVGEVRGAKTKVNNGKVYSELQIIPQMSDNRKMLLCQITSPVFPDSLQSCHVGPIDVIRNPSGSPRVVTKIPPLQNIHFDTSSIKTTIEIAVKADCRKTCSSIASSHVSFWIIATVVAGIFALTFLFVGIILIVKYNRLHVHGPANSKQLPPHLNREYIYSELEHKPVESQVYMSLEKRDKLTCPAVGQLKGHYHVASLVQPS